MRQLRVQPIEWLILKNLGAAWWLAHALSTCFAYDVDTLFRRFFLRQVSKGVTKGYKWNTNIISESFGRNYFRTAFAVVREHV